MKQYWWSGYESFAPEDETEMYPNPADVLDFYLQDIPRGKQRIARIGEILQVKRALAYRILKQGTDSISYSRKLVAALSIPPQLLKLDTRYAPIQDHPLWWQQQGIPCPADEEGYPQIGKVITFLRKSRTKQVGNEHIAWRQQDLAAALGLTKETIIKMEKEKNEQALDSMTRRKLLALALGGGAASTYALLGLHMPSTTTRSIVPIYIPGGKVGSEQITGYNAQQGLLYHEYFQSHGEGTIGEALEWIQILNQQVLPYAVRSQQVSIFELISRYHQHILDVAREQRNKRLIKFHSIRAIDSSEKASLVSKTPEEKSRSYELMAAALLRVAEGCFEQGDIQQAKTYITRALALPVIESSHTYAHVLLDFGLISMHNAKSERERMIALSHFDRVHAILNTRIDDTDNNFIKSDHGITLIRKAMAQVSSKKAPGDIFETLDMAQELTPTELKRRHVILSVFRSQALIHSGEYAEATRVALEALQKSQEIHSRLNRDRIQGLYEQLSITTHKGDPMLVRLGVQLQLWR